MIMENKVYASGLLGKKIYVPGPGIIKIMRGEFPKDSEPVFFFGEVGHDQGGYHVKTKKRNAYIRDGIRVFLDMHDNRGVIINLD